MKLQFSDIFIDFKQLVFIFYLFFIGIDLVLKQKVVGNYVFRGIRFRFSIKLHRGIIFGEELLGILKVFSRILLGRQWIWDIKVRGRLSELMGIVRLEHIPQIQDVLGEDFWVFLLFQEVLPLLFLEFIEFAIDFLEFIIEIHRNDLWLRNLCLNIGTFNTDWLLLSRGSFFAYYRYSLTIIYGAVAWFAGIFGLFFFFCFFLCIFWNSSLILITQAFYLNVYFYLFRSSSRVPLWLSGPFQHVSRRDR